jgi:hypothetical protein
MTKQKTGAERRALDAGITRHVTTLPAGAKPLRETMKRSGLDLAAIDGETFGVVPQTGGAAKRATAHPRSNPLGNDRTANRT